MRKASEASYAVPTPAFGGCCFCSGFKANIRPPGLDRLGPIPLPTRLLVCISGVVGGIWFSTFTVKRTASSCLTGPVLSLGEPVQKQKLANAQTVVWRRMCCSLLCFNDFLSVWPSWPHLRSRYRADVPRGGSESDGEQQQHTTL